MFENAQFFATIPATDVDASRGFWENTIGLSTDGVKGPDGSLRFHAPGGQIFCLYPTQFAGTAEHTIAGFEVADFDAVADKLRAKGVKFEDYDYPTLKTVDGIATMGDLKGAWFKDPDGNIIGLVSKVPALV